MIKFSLKIDDQEHSLTKENGISIGRIGALLEALFNVIETGTGSNITLGQIRGNCYALDFYTEDEGYLSNFITTHKNIERIQVDELSPDQKKYASTLRLILGNKFFLKAYDNLGAEIALIKDIGKIESNRHYFSTDTIYGILSELGSSSLSNTKKHIFIDGTNYRIYISKDQDLQLKPFYGTEKLRVKIRQKRSADGGRILSSELISFTIVGKRSLIDNLNAGGDLDLEILKGAYTIEDILRNIYANR